MEPEIARRCKACGAAMRSRSAFCPQCGVGQTEGEARPAPASAPPVAPEAPQRKATDSRPGVETFAARAQTEAPVKMETPATEAVRGLETTALPAAPVENPLQASAAPAAPGVASSEAATERRQQRVTPAMVARGAVEDGGRNRAEKLRRASNVVLDEAAADPSLRFVLVATALILISVLILLLARVL